MITKTDRKTAFVTIIIIALALLSGALNVPKAKAATIRNFSLTGAFVSGWNGTMPGPTIVVEPGDTVNITLTGTDGITHRFFVSYHNSSTPEAGDPQSPDFGVVNPTITYSFVATTTVATYTYYCFYHPLTMFGTFKVVPVVPEFPPALVLPLFMALTLVAVMLLKRRLS